VEAGNDFIGRYPLRMIMAGDGRRCMMIPSSKDRAHVETSAVGERTRSQAIGSTRPESADTQEYFSDIGESHATGSIKQPLARRIGIVDADRRRWEGETDVVQVKNIERL
jgi:hypothetical protein